MLWINSNKYRFLTRIFHSFHFLNEKDYFALQYRKEKYQYNKNYMKHGYKIKLGDLFYSHEDIWQLQVKLSLRKALTFFLTFTYKSNRFSYKLHNSFFKIEDK